VALTLDEMLQGPLLRRAEAHLRVLHSALLRALDDQLAGRLTP
jgi:hypothetical protein